MPFTPPKRPTEKEFFAFDYARQLGTGETISSASVAVTVKSGTDGNPSAMVSGTANIVGERVSQLIIGGTADVQYCIACTAVTSLGQEIVLEDDLWVRALCS